MSLTPLLDAPAAIQFHAFAALPLAVLAARRRRVSAHRKAMISTFLGALVIAGAFTLPPGRIMSKVVFGG